MPRTSRASDMKWKVKFYKQVNILDKETGKLRQVWYYQFSQFCREKTIFREQLEAVLSGANVLRDRLEMECRYTEKIHTGLRCVHKGQLYEISIAGDTSGRSDTTRFLIERVIDGGVTA